MEALYDSKIHSPSKKRLRFDTPTTNDSEETLTLTSPSKCASFSSSATSFSGKRRISKMKSRRFFSNPRYIGNYSHRHLENPMLRKKYFRLSRRILSNFKVKNKILCVSILKPKLQLRKTLGYLTNASQFVVDICTQAEKTFKWTERVFNIFEKNYSNLLSHLVLTTLNSVDPKLFNVFNQHLFDDEPERIHSPAITKMILNDSGNLFRFEDSPRIEKSTECKIRFESVEKSIEKNYI